MKKIKLYGGELALVDDEDYERVSKLKWYKTNFGYAVSAHVDRKTGKHNPIHMHRYIISPPEDMFVDHINGNRLDNRKENLRLATSQQNSFNRKKVRGKSKYKGVYFNKKADLWCCNIGYNGKQRNMGYFTNEIACALAYNHYASELFGEYAKLNKVEDEYKDMDWTGFKRKIYEKQKNQSKQKGVSYHPKSGKWQANICVNRKNKYLGIFETEEEAIKARLKAEKEKSFHMEVNKYQ